MPIITRNMRIHNARQFKEAFSETDDTKMYVFIGRSDSWANNASPPTPIDTAQATDFDIYKTMISAKKISQSDVEFVIPRNNWLSGRIYHEFQASDTGLYANNFYAVTDEFNVYKCIFNVNNTPSTVKPTSTNTSGIFKTADGYLWKYMYSISAADRLKFVNSNFIPVKEILTSDGSAQFNVQQAAANGTIGAIDVVSRGSGYEQNQSTFSAVTNSSVLIAASTANSAQGFYTGSNIFIKSGLGAGQIRTVQDYNGSTKRLLLDSGFSITPNTSSTYLISPKVTVSGDGTGGQAYAEVFSNGAIANVTIISGGINYSTATVAITANSTHGTGATAVAYNPPKEGHGASAVHELGGHNVMINSRLAPDDLPGFGNVDFRIVGILQDPVLSATGAISNNSTLNMTTRIKVNTVSGTYTEDEFVNGNSSSASGRVVLFANTNATSTEGNLYLNELSGSFANGETLTANQSSVTAISDGIFNKDIQDFSGRVLYVDNVSQIIRAIDQIEDIKLTLRF